MVHHAISCMVSHSDLLLRLPEGAVECKACEEMQKYLDIRLTKFQWAFNVRIRAQRVPDTRPEPEIFFNTRSVPD